jgi:DNA mismatch repair protein MutS
MWKRLLKQSIINPLKNKWNIDSRLEIIDEFLKNKILLNKTREKLKWVSDLENILTRLALWRANPRDLLNLKRSLELVIEATELIKKEGSKKLIWLLRI